MICYHSNCKRESVGDYKGTQYCYLHLDIAKNNDNFGNGYGCDDESYSDTEYIPKSTKPDTSYSYKQEQKPKKESSKKKPKKESSKKQEHDDWKKNFWKDFESKFQVPSVEIKISLKHLPEEITMINTINAFLSNRNLTKDQLKKNGRILLLKVHPDKCKFTNIDAHSVSQIILDKMNQ
jgi:hypothetical protein